MASSSTKAIELKDAYVSDLISKGHGKQPEIKMPEVNHGDVAIEPVTMAIGAAIAGAATLWHTPEVMSGFKSVLGPLTGTKFQKERAGVIENDKQNRGKRLLKQFGIGDYNSEDYDPEHFNKTGKIKPMTAEQAMCSRGYDQYCRRYVSE